MARVDDKLFERLRLRAARRHRSVEVKDRAMPTAAFRPESDAPWQHAEKLREATRHRRTADSAVLLRRDRDRQGGESER